MRKAGRRIAMLGDGVNDAPAIKTADIGISKSSLGSGLATEAADIALMQDDMTRQPYLAETRPRLYDRNFMSKRRE